MKDANFSEYAMVPKYVMVYNPCDFDMFSYFENIDEAELKSKYLFRERPDPVLFKQQHKNFVKKIINSGVEVKYISDLLGKEGFEKFKNVIVSNPNHVYTRDSIIMLPWVPNGYILGNMKSDIRKKEPVVMGEIAKMLRLNEIVKIPSELFLEGGDVIPFSYDGKKVLLIGYERRTSKETLFFLKDSLIRKGIVDEIIGLELAEWRINLDGGFVPVGENIIVTHPDSIINGMLINRKKTVEIDPLTFFRKLGFEILETTKEESIFKQTCNYFCPGNKTVFGYNISNKINDILRKKGITVNEIDGTELVKGTGGPRCMTRPMY